MAERNGAERRRERNRQRRADARNGELSPQTTSTTVTPNVERTSPLSSGYFKRMGLSLGLLAADSYSRDYGSHHIELLSSYGHDVLGIPLWYLATQGIFDRIQFFKSRKNIFLATAISVGFEAMEYLASQKVPEVLDKHMFGSARFDPYDFVAYGVGTAVALGIHKAFYGKNTPQKPN